MAHFTALPITPDPSLMALTPVVLSNGPQQALGMADPDGNIVGVVMVDRLSFEQMVNVKASGGTGNAAVYQEDAPWSVLERKRVQNVPLPTTTTIELTMMSDVKLVDIEEATRDALASTSARPAKAKPKKIRKTGRSVLDRVS